MRNDELGHNVGRGKSSSDRNNRSLLPPMAWRHFTYTWPPSAFPCYVPMCWARRKKRHGSQAVIWSRGMKSTSVYASVGASHLIRVLELRIVVDYRH